MGFSTVSPATMNEYILSLENRPFVSFTLTRTVITLSCIKIYLNPLSLLQMKRNETALIFASERGYLKMVEALVTAGADVNAQTGNGVTALIACSQYGHLEVVQALLAAHADPNVKDTVSESGEK